LQLEDSEDTHEPETEATDDPDDIPF
jgi:hypothetical protein